MYLRPNALLVDLERKLRFEYAEVAKIKEEFWAIKARILWLVEGDRNTSFYHTSTLVHRKRNRIICMKDRMGSWLNGEIEIILSSKFCWTFSPRVRSAFFWLYGTPPIWNTRLNTEANIILNTPITNREIFEGLWVLKSFKGPSPDGLHAGFFQRFWLIVGDFVREEVKRVFSSRIISDYMNQTLITLIPNCRSPESLSNYRLISFCNTIYKIVTKIIVNRIYPFLSELISPLQVAFVPRRKGLDNAITVQELIHTMSKKKGRIGVMAIKLNLEKAYDHLEWSFIRDTLKL